MTRLRGASVSSYEATRGSGGVDRPQFHRSKLPPNAPEIITQNTVDVSDPAQVLLWCRDERRRQFNLLVRRYKSQILYGCQNPGCMTPTCASYRKRVSEGPYRRYTELSARTLACYLASVDNAESGLCRNTPRVASELAPQENQRRPKRRPRSHPAYESKEPGRSAGEGGTEAQAVPDTNSGLVRFDGHTGECQSAESALDKRSHGVPGEDGQPAQRLKDPKSFTQNLFDTLSLRMIEWLPLRRSPSTLDGDPMLAKVAYSTRPQAQEEKTRGHPGHRTDTRSKPDRVVPSRPVGSNPHTPSSRHGSQTAAVELKLPNQQIKRLSVTEVDQWRQTPRSNMEEKSSAELKPARKVSVNTRTNDDLVNISSPPALKHRPQKHRGRAGDVNTTPVPDQRKKERRVSWDGAKFLNEIPVPDTETTPSGRDEQRTDMKSPKERKSKRKGSRRRRNDPGIQSVTHLTVDIVDGLAAMMNLSEDEAQSWREELAYLESTGGFEDSEWRFATPRQRQVFTFVGQSVFYALGSTKQILRSFRDNASDGATSTLDLHHIQPSLRKLFTLCPKDLVFHSLWSAVEALFVPPKELSTPSKASRRSSCNSSTGAPPAPIIRRASDSGGNAYVSDDRAADVATVALLALTGSLPEVDAATWHGILQMRATGTVASQAEMQKLPLHSKRVIVDTTDMLEHELALRLVNRLVRALTARTAFHEIFKARQAYSHDVPKTRKNGVLDRLIDNLSVHHDFQHAGIPAHDSEPKPPGAPAVIAEWLRTLLLREWDGNPEMAKGSAAGGAVQILSVLYKERNRLGLVPEDFHTPFLSERLEPLEMPVDWMGSLSDNRKMHLLSYSFLFPPSALVIYFRALNYAAMSRYYEAAMTTTRHVTQTAFGAIRIQDDVNLLAHMRTSMTTYLVLVVRRDNVLTDALNQVWRRERRELMRPLKVQMGMEEGEEGLDHGGVQQEFFRVLMAEALDPAYGMFTLDGRTRVSWIQPGSLEPLYKFELLGLLMSLAVYNGLTLPVNFPTAFYRRLLGRKVKQLDQLRDGWPELTKGLEGLLSWEDGDVGDVFMRTYEFSFEAFGSIQTIDMQRVDRDAPWPVEPSPLDARRSSTSTTTADATDSQVDIAKSLDGSVPVQSSTPPAEEASLVTNANRAQFVQDYIFWLTDKSIRGQFEAFAQGFYTCLDRTALSIFTPEALKTVVEGIQEIDIGELERHARYEGGFGPQHRVVRDFWAVARRFSPTKKAQLLEFVTASDRVPVNGIASIMFVIQKNGVGDARLPTSLTCFGRLLLPEYSSRSVLEEKLNKALENARGFGVA
ncbi:hypothetical protein BDW42DRAFT_163967 [Aspergillus taichungensis]|uniref:HECT-type E3 ubiquitin transferase n=1 Tax=Aspergillus taichungensis TaxID=482145 RepID=A0A2J5I2A9_9EURO|nr:hypothetical protein BDW42DRAFT_163967 [Aspergillus taichungensis]